MLDEKDILVCVHTRNILRARGCYRYVKVPSSPYKRGRKGTCKRIQTFWNLCYLHRESQSLCALTLYLNVLRTLTCVRVVIRTFRVTPPTLLRPRKSVVREVCLRDKHGFLATLFLARRVYITNHPSKYSSPFRNENLKVLRSHSFFIQNQPSTACPFLWYGMTIVPTPLPG
jgi:hypothetical protein